VAADTSDQIIFLIVVAARFIVPLFIPRFPIPAIVTCLVVDAVDQTIFQTFTDLDLEGYQTYDKALDIFYLTIAYTAALRNWTNGFALEAARFLWYYRLVGVVLFELTQWRALLFIFPNTFEYFFIAYEMVRTRWDPLRLSRRAVLGMAAFIWIFIKLPQEWWIHIAQNDFTDFMKETVFGAEATDGWIEVITNRLWVAALILLAVAGIVVAARRLRSRLPEPDWPARFDADAPLPAHATVPRALETERAGPALAWPVVEKVALITLVTIIFGQLLQIGATSTQILVATVVVVVVNAAVSPFIVRGGSVDRRRILSEFAILAAINTIVITTFSALVADGGINRAASWFFGLLLTLIISLFDRYRSVRLERLDHLDTPAAV
jgi:hypothetical protein